MNIGLAIFLSAIFLGLIWLYYITRDRWNWKKISKYGVYIILILLVITAILFLIDYLYQTNKYNSKLNRDDITKIENWEPYKCEEFFNIKLGQKSANVIFYRGNPTKKLNANLWLYTWGKKNSKNEREKYGNNLERDYKKSVYVFFNSDSTDGILSFYEGSSFGLNLMNEDSWYSYFGGVSSDRIINKLGEPDEVISYDNYNKKLFLYKKFNVVFYLKTNEVYGYGIYNVDRTDYYKVKFIEY